LLNSAKPQSTEQQLHEEGYMVFIEPLFAMWCGY